MGLDLKPPKWPLKESPKCCALGLDLVTWATTFGVSLGTLFGSFRSSPTGLYGKWVYSKWVNPSILGLQTLFQSHWVLLCVAH